MSDELPNVWQWLGRWSPESREAIRWTAAEFPPEIRHRGIARAYYDFLWTLDQILAVLPHGPRGLRVLDVGCGAGVLALALRHLGAEVTAVDRFLEYADDHDNQMGNTRDILERFRGNGIEVQSRDVIAEGLAAEPGRYDLITSFAVIEHLPESPKRLFASMFNALAPGGVVAITTPNHAWIRTRLRLLGGRAAHDPLVEWWTPPFYGHVREYTLAELRQMLEWSGFTVERAVIGNWWHAASRVPAAPGTGADRWTTRFTLDSMERWKTGLSLGVTALVPSLRYSLLGIGRKPGTPR